MLESRLMRITAIICTYNEERFIGKCIGHLHDHGIGVYLLNNGSTDRTAEIAATYKGKGLVGMEDLPREGCFDLIKILTRKQQLAMELDAEWFMHADADEFHIPARPGRTLGEALADIDAQGFNAANFLEFTFTPTKEHPDHDHPRFEETMRWYYPFQPFYPHRLNAWKKQKAPVDLIWRGGHQVKFEGLRMYPESFYMKHYLFLSIDRIRKKYVNMKFSEEVHKRGWSKWRASLKEDMIELESEATMRTFISDATLDPSEPRKQHYLGTVWAARKGT